MLQYGYYKDKKNRSFYGERLNMTLIYLYSFPLRYTANDNNAVKDYYVVNYFH